MESHGPIESLIGEFRKYLIVSEMGGEFKQMMLLVRWNVLEVWAAGTAVERQI